MSTISKLEFAPLDVSGKNYMPWVLDMKIHLESMGISESLKEDNFCSSQDKAKAIVFLRKHIDDSLKYEYLTTEDPSVLWKDLKNRFDNQKEVLLPAAREEWRNLRFQDFKKVNDYSSALFRICSQLKFCGQTITDSDMLEKTFSTFHASSITLQQQLRLQNFTKYSELNAYLLVAEQNNEILIKNHESRPTGSIAFPEANATNNDDSQNHSRGQGNYRGRGRGRGRHNYYQGQNQPFNRNNPYGYHGGRGRGHGCGRGRGRNNGNGQRNNNNNNAPQGNKNQTQSKQHDAGESSSKHPEGACYRCGSLNHWARTCRTPQHLCDLYKESIKEKGTEINVVDGIDLTNTELNTSDFFNDFEI